MSAAPERVDPLGSTTYDAVVVGGGHNGLAAALYLAREGWEVAVVEQNPTVGGAVASAEATLPGYVHDLYSTNQNLFLGSQTFADFGADLQRHGLQFAHTTRPFASVFPGGESLRVDQDYERTLAGLERHDPGDAEGFAALYQEYQRLAPHLFRLYGSALPSRTALRQVVSLLRTVKRSGVSDVARLLTMSTRELGDAWFASAEARSLAAAWGMHLDFAPDVAGGAVFPLLEMYADMENGMSIVAGGAQHLPDAMAALLRELGGTVLTDLPVERILVEGARAVGVITRGGDVLRARKAVIANVGPRALYHRLLAADDVPADTRRRAQRYRYGPGTMMLHLALTGPIPWEAGDGLDRFGYVHIGPYLDDMAATYAEAQAGLLPRSPLLVVGQTTAIDASRAPDGGHVAWIQVRCAPSRIRGDAADRIRSDTWSAAKEPFVERILDKLEEYAPGVGSRIAAWAVATPEDLERANPNLVGGDSVAGSHHLPQNFAFRPLGSPGYRTPVPSLYLTGAATWPGAGNHATSGRLAAAQILGEGRRIGGRLRRP